MKRLFSALMIVVMVLAVSYSVAWSDDAIVDPDQNLEDAQKNNDGDPPDGFDPEANPTNNNDKYDFDEFKQMYEGTDLTPEQIRDMFDSMLANFSEYPEIELLINGRSIEFGENDVMPQIIDGRTLVPLRLVSEELGAQVNYNEIDGKGVVTVVKGSLNLELTIGESTVYTNGNPIVLDVPAMLVEDRTMVPFRFIFEQFNMDVDYDEPTDDYPVTVIYANTKL